MGVRQALGRKKLGIKKPSGKSKLLRHLLCQSCLSFDAHLFGYAPLEAMPRIIARSEGDIQ